jgi:hypothetical protein
VPCDHLFRCWHLCNAIEGILHGVTYNLSAVSRRTNNWGFHVLLRNVVPGCPAYLMCLFFFFFFFREFSRGNSPNPELSLSR